MARLENVKADDIVRLETAVSDFEAYIGIDEDRDDPQFPGKTWGMWHDEALRALINDDDVELLTAVNAMNRIKDWYDG